MWAGAQRLGASPSAVRGSHRPQESLPGVGWEVQWGAQCGKGLAGGRSDLANQVKFLIASSAPSLHLSFLLYKVGTILLIPSLDVVRGPRTQWKHWTHVLLARPLLTWLFLLS